MVPYSTAYVVGRRRLAATFPVLALAALTALSCAGTRKPGSAGTGGTVSTGSGTGGSSTTGSGGSTGAGGDTVIHSDAGACQQHEVSGKPKTPTVYVLVDRSGSEFDNATTGTFFTLRAAVLPIIKQLQGQVAFGFGAFVGDHTAACKLVLDEVPIALNNYDAINTKYGALGMFNGKAETPASQALPMVRDTLKKSTVGTGQKYILLVTDSETDFCDDGNALCPADAVTGLIQDMYTKDQIGTLVVGLPGAMSPVAPTAIQNFANAGAGQPVVVPMQSGAKTATDVHDQCAGVTGWMGVSTMLGRTGTVPIATYGATAGTAMVYAPTSTSQQALADQISQALADVKSCLFDLTDKINISMQTISKGRVYMGTDPLDDNGASIENPDHLVPLDAHDGWSIHDDGKTLELYGSWCEKWRDPKNDTIKFDFPCDIVVQ